MPASVMAARSISTDLLVEALGRWHGGGPLYQSLAHAIRALVMDGSLPLGARLPAERRLAIQLGTSRTTVSLAYSLLRAQRYLVSQRGSGSYTSLPDGQDRVRTIGWTPDPQGCGENLDLTITALPAPSPDMAIATAQALVELPRYITGHGYDPGGLMGLRVAIAEAHSRRGLATAPDQIMITNGALHGLWLMLQLVVDSGARVLTECPTYPNALDAIRGARGRAVPLHVTVDEWRPEPVTDAIRRLRPRLVYVIADFHNPTGRLMPEDSRAALVSAAERTGTLVVSDEATTDLGLGGVTVPPSLACYGGPRSVVTLGTMSKSFWGGLRIGWVRAAPATIRRLSELRAAQDLASSVMDQLTAEQLLGRAATIICERRELLTHRRDFMAAALARHVPQWRFRLPPGGMALWVDLGVPAAKALTQAASRMGVHLVPGGRFSVCPGMLDNFIRIPYTAPEPVLAEAAGRLAQAWARARADD
jgi:DNA-binding transcriptional MocR family regulator